MRCPKTVSLLPSSKLKVSRRRGPRRARLHPHLRQWQPASSLIPTSRPTRILARRSRICTAKVCPGKKLTRRSRKYTKTPRRLRLKPRSRPKWSMAEHRQAMTAPTTKVEIPPRRAQAAASLPMLRAPQKRRDRSGPLLWLRRSGLHWPAAKEMEVGQHRPLVPCQSPRTMLTTASPPLLALLLSKTLLTLSSRKERIEWCSDDDDTPIHSHTHKTMITKSQ
mmetsp:Transcript_12111/g.34652  ORF Transcript_12111/g.34652 Transcript_12111/m.34652 type:complete len:222 (+) Transcript_12111:5485-6150(+)